MSAEKLTDAELAAARALDYVDTGSVNKYWGRLLATIASDRADRDKQNERAELWKSTAINLAEDRDRTAAENERLREALTRIADAHTPSQPASSPLDERSHVMQHVGYLRGIAKAALAANTEGRSDGP